MLGMPGKCLCLPGSVTVSGCFDKTVHVFASRHSFLGFFFFVQEIFVVNQRVLTAL